MKAVAKNNDADIGVTGNSLGAYVHLFGQCILACYSVWRRACTWHYGASWVARCSYAVRRHIDRSPLHVGFGADEDRLGLIGEA